MSGKLLQQFSSLAVTRNAYSVYGYPPTSNYAYSNDQPRHQGPSVGKVIAEKSKQLKNKFMNFFYKRKGYKRVNVNDNQHCTILKME